MTLSIGTDIVEIERMEKIVQRQGDAFVQRILTEKEKSEYHRRKQSVSFLAKRFAAKEAVAKALQTGIGRGVSFQDIEIGNNDDGAPLVNISAGAMVAAKKLGGERVLLSIADEQAYAIAYAVLLKGD